MHEFSWSLPWFLWLEFYNFLILPKSCNSMHVILSSSVVTYFNIQNIISEMIYIIQTSLQKCWTSIFSQNKHIKFLFFFFTHLQWTLIITTAFVSKDVASKMNLLLYRIVMNRMVHMSRKCLVLFLFPQRTYVLDICKNHLTEAIFFHNVSLTVTAWMKVLCKSNCHYSEFCHYIECRYAKGWLYFTNCMMEW